MLQKNNEWERLKMIFGVHGSDFNSDSYEGFEHATITTYNFLQFPSFFSLSKRFLLVLPLPSLSIAFTFVSLS